MSYDLAPHFYNLFTTLGTRDPEGDTTMVTFWMPKMKSAVTARLPRDFSILAVKDLNWYGAPKGEVVEKFKAESTELLIRIGPASHPVLDFLAATKKASLKVGPFTDNSDNPYHLQYDGRESLKPKDQFAAIAKIFTFTISI